ncbi:MAG: DUF3108 domain-containing protein [Methylotenera sp.]
MTSNLTLKRFLDYLFDNKPLMLAIVISAILHLMLLNNLLFIKPKIEGKQQALTVSLVKLQPVKLSHLAIQENLPTPIKPVTNPLVTPAPKTPEAAIKPSHILDKVEPNISDISLAEEPTVSQPTHATELLLPFEQMPNVETITNEINKNAYQHVETEFEVYNSALPDTVSVNTIKFSTQHDGSYLLTNADIDLEELNTLVDARILQERSEGIITAEGLKPNYYTQYYDDDKAGGKHANFDWSYIAIQVGSGYQPLANGTQDELSYMYQFMFFPPQANIQITVTNGALLQSLYFIYLGEEIIQTKLGELKATHLVSNDKVKTDLWLAVDYQFLPVKIRKTINDGSYIEQTATKLSAMQAEIGAE